MKTTTKNSDHARPGLESRIASHVFSHSPVIYYSGALGGESPVAWVSENVESILGCTAAEFLVAANDGGRFVHDDDLDAWRKAPAALARDGHVVQELRIGTAAGEYRWFRDERRVADGDPGREFVGCLSDITEEKHNQSRLRERDEEFRRLSRLLHDALESMPAGFSVRDPDSRLVICNREFASLYDEEPDALVGMSQEDLFRKCLHKIRRVDGEPAVDADGNIGRWCEKLHRERMEIELDNGHWKLIEGHPTSDGGYVTIRTDITREKRAETALRESERRFRQIVESHPMPAVQVADAETGELLYESPAAAAMFGRRLPESRSRNRPSCYVEPADRVHLVANLRRHDDVRDEEVLLAREDGSTFTASICSRLITLDGREAVISGLEDLTARRRIEQAIRGSEEFVRRLVEACPIPVGMLRLRDGKILYTSPAGRKLFGLSSREVRSSYDFYADPADRDRLIGELERRGEVENAEVEYRRADGSTFWGSVSARVVEFEGEPAVVASIYDLTERRAVEEEIARQREALYQSEKLSALGSLLASVAHELNNPLSVVVGQALLLQEMAENPSISERAVKIGKAADRCARIVKTFLGMARQKPAEPRAVNLAEVIEASLAVTGYALRSSDIQVQLRLAPDLPPICGDADQMGQVITNLLINAQHALEEMKGRQRRLKISAEYRDGSREVVLKVKDNGPGIPAEIRSRVFEPFFTTKDVGSGTGIGLAFCHQIIDAHGGIIEVEESQGEGASFAIRLPAAGHVNAIVAESSVEPPSADSLTALVIDDEADVAEVLAEILMDDGHRVDVAHSGTAALQLIKRRDFDVVLSDLRMPGLDGPGLYRILQSRKPRIAARMAFITGDSLSAKSKDFLQSSGRPHIEKPVTPREVRDLVERLTARGEHGASARHEGRAWTANRAT